MVESVSLSLSDTDIELHSTSTSATGWLGIASHTEARGYFEIKNVSKLLQVHKK